MLRLLFAWFAENKAKILSMRGPDLPRCKCNVFWIHHVGVMVFAMQTWDEAPSRCCVGTVKHSILFSNLSSMHTGFPQPPNCSGLFAGCFNSFIIVPFGNNIWLCLWTSSTISAQSCSSWWKAHASSLLYISPLAACSKTKGVPSCMRIIVLPALSNLLTRILVSCQ